MSVLELLKNINDGPNNTFIQPPERKDQIENSEGLRSTVAGNINDRKRLMDRYYMDQSIKKGKILNASGLSISKSYMPRYYERKEWLNSLDGAIDPNVKRLNENADEAQPRDYSEGLVGGYYQLEEDDYRAYSEDVLLRKAMDSYSRARGGIILSEFINDTPAKV